MKVKLLILVLLFATIFLHCAKQQEERTNLDHLQKIIAEFQEAVQKKDVGKIVSMYADDAMMLPDDQKIVSGKQAIAEHWNTTAQSDTRIKVVEKVRLSRDGNIAYQINKMAVAMPVEGHETKWNPSKNVHIWKKQTTEIWKLQVDIWNSSVSGKKGM